VWVFSLPSKSKQCLILIDTGSVCFPIPSLEDKMLSRLPARLR
jgi:hypothetical protein